MRVRGPLESKNVTRNPSSHLKRGIGVNRKQADTIAGGLVVTIVLLGVLSAIQLRSVDSPMSGEMGSVPVMAIVGPVLMSLVIASLVGGVYIFVRGQVFEPRTATTTKTDLSDDPEETTTGDRNDPVKAETDEIQPPDSGAQQQILDVLPNDERRILEPVVESPGLTQIEVRDRSGFSKSKVSQTITDLEKRGLLYRESQGRTYRVYPADDFDEHT